jgi:hypothetical protein
MDRLCQCAPYFYPKGGTPTAPFIGRDTERLLTVTRTCYLPTLGRNRITHRQALTATAAKIIHTRVQPC